MLPTYCLEVCLVCDQKWAFLHFQPKGQENSLFPCIQVKNSLADFIISTVFLKDCFILLGEQKEQNNSLPLRSSPHLLRGSPTTITETEDACATFALAAEVRTCKASSTQRAQAITQAYCLWTGSTGKWVRWDGAAVAAATLVSKAAVFPMSYDGHVSNGSHRVCAQQWQLWGFHCWEEKLILYQCWFKWRGTAGDGAKKHLWLTWG